ncbi:MAG: DUF2336 domain-containing protein [Variibacter sp.]|nr:DUF2336 domain-containing protein [Variibacter sp.]
MARAFANLDGLLRLSRTEGVDIRPALLRVITDLFVQEPIHTREEIRQYAELCLRLLPAVDGQTRAAVLAKLAAFPATPPWLLEEAQRVAADPAAAPRVPGNDRLRGQSGASAPAPASASRAPADAAFAPPTTEPETPQSLGERFLRAEARERQALLIRFQDTEPEAEPPTWMRDRAQTIERLERFAAERNPRGFARELQDSFGLSSRIAAEIAHDDGGEPLLVVAKAIAMPADALLRILLLLNPAVGQSVERVFSLYRLYERLRYAAVAPIMTSWREDSRARLAARFQSIHAEDASPARESLRAGFRLGGEPAAARPPANAPTKVQGTT